MKPIQARLSDNLSANKVFLTKEIVQPYYATAFHFHPECQLTYIVESSGQRVIGDNVEHFEPGELVFLGSNVPHVWYNEKKYFEGSHQLRAHSIAMYLYPDRLIESMDAFGERNLLENWLTLARQGIVYSGASKVRMVALFREVFRQDGIGKTIAFLQLLDKLMHTTEYRLLASPNYVNSYIKNDQQRMDKLFRFIFAHYRQDISLHEAASLVNMNPFSFCRYFKSRTQKPFIQFVNELRIGHACRLMQEQNYIIDHLAHECGFNNQTHFNRLFKRTKGMTPKEYRRQLRSLI